MGVARQASVEAVVEICAQDGSKWHIRRSESIESSLCNHRQNGDNILKLRYI